MGYSTTVYLQPYARCKVFKSGQSESIITCSNEKCDEYNREQHRKFCGSCGSAILTRLIVKLKDSVNQWDVEATLSEALYCAPPNDGPYEEGYHIWVSNRKYDNDGNLKLNEEDGNRLYSLTQLNIQDAMFRFHKFFEKEIGILKTHYGAENVSIGYGLMQMVW